MWQRCDCTNGLLICFCTRVLERLCLCVCLQSCLCEISCVGVEHVGRENINTLQVLFFLTAVIFALPPLHPHQLWIKSAIKTFIHVSVKDMRHINGTHTMSSLLPAGRFHSMHIFALAALLLGTSLSVRLCIIIHAYTHLYKRPVL